MDLESFVKIYNGQKIDYDGFYGPQCVDLFRQYCKDSLLILEHTGGCSTSGGAKDLYIDYPKMPIEKKYFNRYPTTKTLVSGDVLVWGETDKNKYGHVAIYLGKLGNSLLVFEQDGLKQDGAKINIRSKDNLLGILRRKW